MSEPFVNCKNDFPRLVMQDSPCLLTTVPIPGNIRCVLDKTLENYFLGVYKNEQRSCSWSIKCTKLPGRFARRFLVII